MLALIWEELMKQARVPAEVVDIVFLRLGLSLDSRWQHREELRAAHERWPTPDTLITLEDFLSVVVPVINDEVRSANAEERELTAYLRELQAWHESPGAILSHRFSQMLLGGSDSEPDTISMSDGRDGGDVEAEMCVHGLWPAIQVTSHSPLPKKTRVPRILIAVVS